MTKKCDVLVLGATGMLGSAVLKYFFSRREYSVIGTMRGFNVPSGLEALESCVIGGIDVENIDMLTRVLAQYKPSYVINCVGLVKQLAESNDPLKCMPINSLLPHRLAHLCNLGNARFVHISTDCVFDGEKGMYLESDWPNARDLYGRSKLLGEVDYSNSITLRTSIIGHEIGLGHSLLEWFLGQTESSINGFSKAVFSGFPTVELARIIHDYVIPEPYIHGLYHVSSNPINKYELLKLIAKEYSKDVDVKADDSLVIDRSLDSSKFREATRFQSSSWQEMVAKMREFG